MRVRARSQGLGWIGRYVAGLIVGLLLGALGASGASAGSAGGILSPLLSPCPEPLSQPFLSAGDIGWYASVPNGGFEAGGASWTFAGGAGIVSGNEDTFVRAASDAFSLSLPPGSSATTATACIGTLSPTFRFFARNSGAPTAALRVDVVYRDVLGLRWTLPVATFSAGVSWEPTPPALLLANLIALPLLTDGAAHVQLRFTPLGPGGAWQIDDVYVDPFKVT
jgi:hypothetical protein